MKAVKKVKFIRHSFLAPPFDNYDNLSFAQLCDLATGRVKPSINAGSLVLLKQNPNLLDLQNYDLILAGSSPRTQQTAQLIQDQIPQKVPLIVSENLEEIYFDPALLTTKKKFRTSGMKEIRIALFTALIKGSAGAEELKEVSSRVERLKKELEKQKATNIICVTHAFYMRFLELYFLDKQTDFGKLSLHKLMQITRYPYLEGFEITLN